MACVILIHAKNWQERNRVLASLDDDISSEVIYDLKKYAEETYKGRFVSEEEIGGGGNSTQMATTGPVGVENKEVPLLEEMARNSQMNVTESNASTNANADVKRENDNEQSVEPEVENEPVVVAEGSHPNIADIPSVDNELSSTTNINNTDASLNGKIIVIAFSFIEKISYELPLYAYLNAYTDDVSMDIQENDLHTDHNGIDVPYLDNVVEMEKDITEDGEDVAVNNGIDVAPTDDVRVASINDEPSTSTKRRSRKVTKKPRDLLNEVDVDMDDVIVDNGSENSPKENTKSPSNDNVPSTSAIRRSSKRPTYSKDDEDSDAQVTKKIAKQPQQPASKKQKSTKRSDDVSEVDSSTRTRSESSVKKPRYAEYDEDEKDDCQASAKVVSTFKKQSESDDTKRIECNICSKQLSPNCRKFGNAKIHAIIHTELKRYQCSKKGCTYRSGRYNNLAQHIQGVHKDSSSKPKEISLTTEQEEELDQVTKECFPVFGTRKGHKVCEVCQKDVLNNILDQHYLKRHALNHIEFMLYKCNQSKCQYATKSHRHLLRHACSKHGIEKISKDDVEIKLTDDQKKEIDDMLKRCFPNEDEDVDE